jgi:hypothetical protein
LTENEKQEIRDKQKSNAERLEKAFAPYFLGQLCPVRNAECVGPACLWFQRQVENDKIVGGNCSVNIIAQGIAGGLVPAAFQMLAQRNGDQPGQLQRVIVPGQNS